MNYDAAFSNIASDDEIGIGDYVKVMFRNGGVRRGYLYGGAPLINRNGVLLASDYDLICIDEPDCLGLQASNVKSIKRIRPSAFRRISQNEKSLRFDPDKVNKAMSQVTYFQGNPTAEFIAELLCRPVTQILDALNGKSMPNIVLCEIADVLETSVDLLLASAD